MPRDGDHLCSGPPGLGTRRTKERRERRRQQLWRLQQLVAVANRQSEVEATRDTNCVGGERCTPKEEKVGREENRCDSQHEVPPANDCLEYFCNLGEYLREEGLRMAMADFLQASSIQGATESPPEDKKGDGHPVHGQC